LYSPSGSKIPPEICKFNLVFFNAVFEHLLPEERDHIGRILRNVTEIEGTLLLFDTPDRQFPIETNTSGLPFINYLPNRLAFEATRRLSWKVRRNISDEELLRAGLRGATPKEIERCLSAADA
jgi:hypothetical protein